MSLHINYNFLTDTSFIKRFNHIGIDCCINLTKKTGGDSKNLFRHLTYELNYFSFLQNTACIEHTIKKCNPFNLSY